MPSLAQKGKKGIRRPPKRCQVQDHYQHWEPELKELTSRSHSGVEMSGYQGVKRPSLQMYFFLNSVCVCLYAAYPVWELSRTCPRVLVETRGQLWMSIFIFYLVLRHGLFVVCPWVHQELIGQNPSGVSPVYLLCHYGSIEVTSTHNCCLAFIWVLRT